MTCCWGFGKLAEAVEHRFAELNNINSDEGLRQFGETEPALVLSIRYGVILKEEALSLPRHGVMNLHSGRLPAYKGVMATFWALLSGEQEIGTTLHYIDDASIDTGRVVATSSLAVNSQKSYLWHVLSLYEEGCQQMAGAAEAIAEGKAVVAIPQAGRRQLLQLSRRAGIGKIAKQGWRLWDPEDVVELASRFVGPA